ncbi:unnamed protein product [Macrosiphum euphorbiae]|uniref:Uncharacterized protein n=1 Tax=Macrosiphum euphorbiae TaxID=13131 RepID=A0AAV0VTV0_9HEMI|nr:unnamed protein product [Macrosiphum euphorbiae]
MNLLKKVCFIYLILNLTFFLFVNSYGYDDYEDRKKYDGNLPNDNKTCEIPWETSIMSEPTPTCYIMCKVRCIILSRTVQWRCKASLNGIWENCHCCNDERLYLLFGY